MANVFQAGHMLRNLKMVKMCTPSFKVHNIDFNKDGDVLVTATPQQLDIYTFNDSGDACSVTGVKQGAASVKFTHDRDQLLQSPVKAPNCIRLYNIPYKQHASYYLGHTDTVHSLAISPATKTFMSASLDKTVRVWGMNLSYSQATFTLRTASVVACHPLGNLYTVGNCSGIYMYDLRKRKQRPIVKYVEEKSLEDFHGIKYSPDGELIAAIVGNTVKVLDASCYKLLYEIEGYSNKPKTAIEASFTPDSKHILTGGDGLIHIWNAENGAKFIQLKSRHTDTINCIKHNPMYNMFASAGSIVGFWKIKSSNINM